MTICIYDKHFSTLGGGEKHIGAVAEILSKNHEVYIFYSDSFKKEDLKKRLNLTLDNVYFLAFDSCMSVELNVTAIVQEMKADLFINATHFSRLYIDGVKNMTLIFFPRYIYPHSISFKEMIKYRVGKLLFKEYNSKVKFYNFSSLEINHGCLGRWSHSKSHIEIRSDFNEVEIFYESFKNGVIKDIIKYIRLGGRLNFYFDRRKFYFHFKNQSLRPAMLELGFNTFVPSEIEAGSNDSRNLGLFITLVKIDTFSLITKFVIKLWQTQFFKSAMNRLFIKSDCIEEQLRYKKFLAKNELILSNSQYTSGWLSKMYGKQSNHHVLYPPVSVNDFYSGDKKNYIIAVGRFFVGDHNKKQLELIKFFKKMYDAYPEVRNYTFHLCGGTHSEQRNENYVKMCQAASEGYPIQIHPNVKYDDLRELYAQSKIFWHGAGLYENEQQNPDKFEHFGITTVEAMASGCVPIVIGLAGQLEIVDDDINGFHWKSEEELDSLTRKVMMDEELRKRLSLNALKRAKEFDHEHFKKNVINIFNENNVPV